MNKPTCQTIQSELDLLMLGERCSAEVTVHLSECGVCRDFQAKQTKLREIVGSLGTVSAPADFDFRLRARLANERPASGLSGGVSWLFGPRAVAGAGSVLAIVLAVVVFIGFKSKPVQQTANLPSAPETVAATVPSSPTTPNEPASGKENEVIGNQSTTEKKPETVIGTTARNSRNQRTTKRPMAVEEFSSMQAERVNGSVGVEPADSVFQIETSQQPYRVSLFDGRGKARTISVPAVSFGSQRAIPTSNQFAPKGIW